MQEVKSLKNEVNELKRGNGVPTVRPGTSEKYCEC